MDVNLKSNQYEIIDDVLFRRNSDFVLLRCLERYESQNVLQELHDGLAGEHFGGDTIAHKIMRVVY